MVVGGGLLKILDLVLQKTNSQVGKSWATYKSRRFSYTAIKYWGFRNGGIFILCMSLDWSTCPEYIIMGLCKFPLMSLSLLQHEISEDQPQTANSHPSVGVHRKLCLCLASLHSSLPSDFKGTRVIWSQGFKILNFAVALSLLACPLL